MTDTIHAGAIPVMTTKLEYEREARLRFQLRQVLRGEGEVGFLVGL